MADLELPKKEKKKKTKKTVEEVTDGVGELDLTKKKKKSSKDKLKPDGDGGDSEGSKELDLSAKKKKSRKASPGEEGGVVPDLVLGTKKKKTNKDKAKKTDEKTTEQAKKVCATERFMDELDESKMAKFAYEDLLERVFDKMDSIGVGKGGKSGKKFVTKPPVMNRIGTKRTAWSNFPINVEDLNRPEKHVMQYVLAELGTSGNLDGTKQLIIKGKFKPVMIENVLRQYIKEYVICHTCKSSNTYMQKIDRLTFLCCNDCSSRQTVAQIKTGFTAVVGKRKKLREKAEGAAPTNTAVPKTMAGGGK